MGGTYSNGSDERDRASDWFERCWFGMFPENTLLRHLLEWGYDPEDYVECLENIEGAENDKRHYAEHPEEYDDEEMLWIDDDIEEWQDELNIMTEDWKPKKEPNMDKELENIKKWIAEKKSLVNRG